MTSTFDETTNDHYIKVGHIPSFSGEDIDYEMWREDVDVWEYHTTIGEKFKGAKLYGQQLNKEVKDVMRAVGMDIIKSEQGYAKIMAAMDAHYRMEEATISWDYFDTFIDASRGKNESSAKFLRRFELMYNEAKRYDIEVQCSPRMLCMLAIKRLHISRDVRANLLSSMKGMKGGVSIRNLQRAIQALYGTGKDVPWEKENSKEPALKDEAGFVTKDAEYMMGDGGDDGDDGNGSAYWSKGAGKTGKKSNQCTRNGFVCKRCGLPGHTSVNCEMDWKDAQKSLAKNEAFGYRDDIVGMHQLWGPDLRRMGIRVRVR